MRELVILRVFMLEPRMCFDVKKLCVACFACIPVRRRVSKIWEEKGQRKKGGKVSSVGNLVGESDDNVIITIGWKKAVVIKALKKRKVSFGYFCVLVDLLSFLN